MGKVIYEGLAKEDDPIYKNGLVIDIRPDSGKSSKPPSEPTPQTPSTNTGTLPQKAERTAEE